MHLHTICDNAIACYPDKIAIQGEGYAVSYRELVAKADALAQHWIASGFQIGERMALWLPNCPEALIAYLACFRAGLIAVALDFRYRPDEAAYCLQCAEACAVIVDSRKWDAFTKTHSTASLRQVLLIGPGVKLEDQLQPLTQTDQIHRDDTDYLSTIFFTSGTTRRPKGVTHTSRRTVSRIEKFIEEIFLNENSVSLAAASLMRPMAFQLLAMAIFRVSGTVVLLPQFSPELFWKAYLAPPQKTILALTPNLLAEVLSHPLALESRNRGSALWLIGGDRTPAQLHREFDRTVNGELIETCGMTETGPYAMNPPFKSKRIGSIGVAPIGVLLRLVDARENDVLPGEIGRVVVRTPDTMIGYWNDTLATYEVLRDGWMHTGDLARADEDGYLWLEGRLKEIIVRDGANVSAIEIESLVLEGFPIAAAAVVGIPDPPHGEAVHLFVVSSSADPSRLELQIYELLRDRLRPAAIPEKIHWIADLPRNNAGKVDRAHLRVLAAATSAGPASASRTT